MSTWDHQQAISIAFLAAACWGVTWWLVTETVAEAVATALSFPASPLVDDTDADADVDVEDDPCSVNIILPAAAALISLSKTGVRSGALLAPSVLP